MGTLDQEWAAFLDLMQEYIEAARLPASERLRSFREIETRCATLPRSYAIIHSIVPSMTTLVCVDLANQARLLTAQTAVAVERYRIAAGRLPVDLSDLVPAYLDGVPEDPFDGRPLRYRILKRATFSTASAEMRRTTEARNARRSERIGNKPNTILRSLSNGPEKQQRNPYLSRHFSWL